jgi:hypothetical protein
MHNFLPSAVQFHYQFNLREMSNVVGGLCRMTRNEFREPVQVGARAGCWLMAVTVTSTSLTPSFSLCRSLPLSLYTKSSRPQHTNTNSRTPTPS